MRKPNPYRQSLKLLEELHKEYPSFSIARHLSTALADYGNFWGLSDKEFHFALEKYQLELAYDSLPIINEEYVDRIVEDAKNLYTILDDEQEEDEDY